VNIALKQQGEIAVLALSGNIMGGPDYEKFHSEVRALMHEGVLSILLDFRRVSFINSTGLGLLMGAKNVLEKAGGRMKICNVSDRVRSIFYVTELHNVFDILPDRKAGLAAFG